MSCSSSQTRILSRPAGVAAITLHDREKTLRGLAATTGAVAARRGPPSAGFGAANRVGGRVGRRATGGQHTTTRRAPHAQRRRRHRRPHSEARAAPGLCRCAQETASISPESASRAAAVACIGTSSKESRRTVLHRTGATLAIRATDLASHRHHTSTAAVRVARGRPWVARSVMGGADAVGVCCRPRPRRVPIGPRLRPSGACA